MTREKAEFTTYFFNYVIRKTAMLAESVSKQVIGKPLTEAQLLLQQNGLTCNITKVDGVVQQHMLTADYRPDRINLVIENGVVTSTTIG